MKKTELASKINSILPLPLDEGWSQRYMSILNRIQFHKIELNLKHKFDFSYYIIQEAFIQIYDKLLENEDIKNKNERIIIEVESSIYEIESKGLKSFFKNELSNKFSPTTDDIILLFPESRIVLASFHEGEIYKANFKDAEIIEKFRYRYRISNNKKYLTSKDRYEVMFNTPKVEQSLISDLRVEHLKINDIKNDTYPTQGNLLNRDEVKYVLKLMEINQINFNVIDRQKDRAFINAIK